MAKYDYVAFIGRFEPWHNGHMAVLKQACELGDNVILVLGSSNVAPTVKNPFTASERAEMISKLITLENGVTKPVYITSVRDYLYDDTKWVNEVQASVAEIAGYDKRVALIGYHKDDSSYYLNLFPNWDFVHATPSAKIDATNIRNLLLEDKSPYDLVPAPITSILTEFKTTERFTNLQKEHEYYKQYKKDWENSPYDPSFNCVDAVVIQNNMVLVVTRKDHPGKGLYALPGGFIHSNEHILDACIRELKEETSIVYPVTELKDSLTEVKVFSHPNRSLRGRTYSFAHCFRLNEKVLPQITGGDDASHAKWLPIRDMYKYESSFFEDHVQIVSYFLERNSI